MFQVGQTYSTTLHVNRAMVEKFADFSGDINPIHVELKTARAYGHPKPVAHGAILVAVLSRLIGMEIPGPGAVWLSQDIQWLKPIYVDDHVTVILEVINYSKGAALLTLEASGFNQNNERVMKGVATVKVGKPLVGEEKTMQKCGLALVTGGSRGIGSTLCSHLAEKGYDIALLFKNNVTGAEQTALEVEALGRECQLIQADLSQPLESFSEEIQEVGRVDAFIHCASPAISPVPVTDDGRAQARVHWRVTCEAAMEIVGLIAPGMIERSFGRLIFMGTSGLKDGPQAGWAPYLMAKHSLWGYVRSLAAELGPKGITANMISPSLIVTDLTADIPHRAKEVEARKNPMRRLAVPEDVAETAGFICQPQASFVNGQNIYLTGGA